MGLKVELKPGERFILGECVVTNGDQRTRLLIEGQAPILREKDIMTPEQADTPGQTHLSLRPAHVHRARPEPASHDVFRADARPGAGGSEFMAAYARHRQPRHSRPNDKALKSAKTLITYEKELLDNAKLNMRLRRDRESDRKSA